MERNEPSTNRKRPEPHHATKPHTPTKQPRMASVVNIGGASDPRKDSAKTVQSDMKRVGSAAHDMNTRDKTPFLKQHAGSTETSNQLESSHGTSKSSPNSISRSLKSGEMTKSDGNLTTSTQANAEHERRLGSARERSTAAKTAIEDAEAEYRQLVRDLLSDKANDRTRAQHYLNVANEQERKLLLEKRDHKTTRHRVVQGQQELEAVKDDFADLVKALRASQTKFLDEQKEHSRTKGYLQTAEAEITQLKELLQEIAAEEEEVGEVSSEDDSSSSEEGEINERRKTTRATIKVWKHRVRRMDRLVTLLLRNAEQWQGEHRLARFSDREHFRRQGPVNLSVLVKELGSKDEEIEALKTQCDVASKRSKEEIDRFNASKTAMQTARAAHWKEIEQLQQQNATFRIEASASKKETERIQQENANLRFETGTLKKEIERSLQQNAVLRLETSASQKKLEELQSTVTSSVSRDKDHPPPPPDPNLKSLQKRYADLQQNYENLSSHVEGLVAKHEREREIYAENTGKFSAELTKWHTRVLELEGELEEGGGW